MNLIAGVKAILLSPKTEWVVIDGEPATVPSCTPGTWFRSPRMLLKGRCVRVPP